MYKKIAPISTLVIACGAIASEIMQIKKLYSWNDITVKCLPPELHNFPERIPPAIEEKIISAKLQYKNIFVAYADCGTGGLLDKVLKKHGIERLAGAHCYEFFCGSKSFNDIASQEPGTFYVTDFLLRNFERLVVQGLGLKKHPHLLAIYFGNYKRLLYLAQSPTDELKRLCEQYAEYLGLEYEFMYTGLDQVAAQMKVIPLIEQEWQSS